MSYDPVEPHALQPDALQASVDDALRVLDDFGQRRKAEVRQRHRGVGETGAGEVNGFEAGLLDEARR